MSSDFEDEDFAEYGTALDPLDEDAVPRKKPFSMMDQVVKDKHGRRRFHGAFTGGFSAGFFNSVGSLEGWTPSTFKSSRSDKAEKTSQRPEDFMDEEDIDEFGIAPKVIRATSDFSDHSKKRGRTHHLSDGPIPGEPVLRELLQAVKETVGVKLLKKMGWKPGQGTGPRLTKVQKTRMKADYNKIGATKLYGCSLPQDDNSEKQSDKDNTNSTDDENDADITFAPDDLQPFLCKPKLNCFGLGYSGLERRSILSSHINLFETTPLSIEENKKKVLISGQAFGVGALEEDDDDIYAREDMSQYDFSLDNAPTTSKQKQQVNKIAIASYVGSTLIGFVLSTNTEIQKKHFPPPLLPQGFQPIHVTRKSRFEAIHTTETVSHNKETESYESRRKGLQRHNLTAPDRAQILGESITKSTPKSECVNSRIEEENKSVDTEKLVICAVEGRSQFRPFIAHPEKQKRYEQYLALTKVGQKDRLSYIQPLSMTEWEKEHERIEFEQASRLYQPLSGVMSDRFVSASENEDLNDPLPSISKKAEHDNEQKASVKLKMFGSLTREEADWRPCSLLCKRFNIPELFPGSGEPPNATQKNTSKFSVFNFLDASSYNTTQNLSEILYKETVNEVPSTSDTSEITVKQESEVVDHEVEHITTNISSQNKSEDSALEFPDPPAKIDLYKAIFLSSSEDSDSDGETQSGGNHVKELKLTEISSSEINKTEIGLDESVSQEKIVASNENLTTVGKNIQRNTSPPRGIFANLDLDAINVRKEKSNIAPEKTKQSDDSNDNKIANNNHPDCVIQEQNKTELMEEYMYGPQLPSVSPSTSKNIVSVPTVNKILPSVITSVRTEWVEKTKKNSHKDKHNKKHKKTSKHKKHKHKKKRH